MSKKTFTILLGTSPYGSENTWTAINIARSALSSGHEVNLIATADGVYNFMTKQKAAHGAPRVMEEFGALMEAGLKVHL